MHFVSERCIMRTDECIIFRSTKLLKRANNILKYRIIYI
jgi:hypothetical protein